MLEISHSSASVAEQCWKKWYFQYVMRLEPTKIAHHMYLGRVYHDALFLCNMGVPTNKITDFITDTFNDEMAKNEKADHEQLIINRHTVMGMFLSYPHKDLTQWQEMYPEEEFKCRLGNMRNVKFVGRVDGRVKWNDHYWLREYKTTGLSQRMFEQRAAISSQCTGYVYGVERQHQHPIAGVIYDVVKRPLLRKRMDETAEKFGMRIQMDYATRPQFYHLRYAAYRTTNEVALFENDLMSLVKDIREKKKTGRWNRNTGACYNYNSECPYKKICFCDKPDKLTLELYYHERKPYKKDDNDLLSKWGKDAV